MPVFPSVELSRLPKLEPSSLRLLWVNDWYDGPLEAVVEHAGARCLMVLHHHEPDSERPYRWIVVPLTPEQAADEAKWHALYVEHVGDHWCFHGEGVFRHPPLPSTERDPARFHALYLDRPQMDLSGNESVGWTDEMPKR